MTTVANQPVNDKVREQVDTWLAKFPSDQRRSAVLMGLKVIQDTYGWLKDEQVQWLADYLGIPESQVFEVVSFYSLYKRSPEGQYVLKVCNSVSCYLGGSGAMIKHLKQLLGIELGETTADGLFTLKETECIAACCQAPALMVNDKKCHGPVTKSSLNALVTSLKQGQKSG